MSVAKTTQQNYFDQHHRTRNTTKGDKIFFFTRATPETLNQRPAKIVEDSRTTKKQAGYIRKHILPARHLVESAKSCWEKGKNKIDIGTDSSGVKRYYKYLGLREILR